MFVRTMNSKVFNNLQGDNDQHRGGGGGEKLQEAHLLDHRGQGPKRPGEYSAWGLYCLLQQE